MNEQPVLPRLLEGKAEVAPAPVKRAPLMQRVRERLRNDGVLRGRLVIGGRVLAAVAVIGVGIGSYAAFRPTPMPDYGMGDLDDVLGYTLLSEEFNRLPVEERLKLIGQLVERFKKMDAGDSVLLASFAEGIAGPARQQLMENASRLAVDTWDKFAVDYAEVPAGEQEKFLDNTFVEFTKMMEAVAGEPRDVSDEERLAEGRRQAQRDLEVMRSGDRRPPAQALGRMFRFMNEGVGGHASPTQRVRGQQMMRDMVRHLRGQDVSTGAPKTGGG